VETQGPDRPGGLRTHAGYCLLPLPARRPQTDRGEGDRLPKNEVVWVVELGGGQHR
jgi:hypothetical protein